MDSSKENPTMGKSPLYLELDRFISRYSHISPRTRAEIVGFVTGDPELHRAFTRFLHHLLMSPESTAIKTAASFMGPLGSSMAILQTGGTLFDLAVIYLAREAERNKRLSATEKREVLALLNRQHL